MKIVILDTQAGNPYNLPWNGLEQLGDCTFYDHTTSEQVAARCHNAQLVLTKRVVLAAPVLATLPQLRYIGVMGTGVNVVDVAQAHRQGIVVTHVPAYSSESVAQLVFAHLLAITNRVEHYTAEAREGTWSRCSNFSYINTTMMELSGKTMGIVGLGNIGRCVARIAQGFGMRVQAFTSKEPCLLPPGISKVGLDDLFATSDVVSLHCPLTPTTRGMVCRERLQLMMPHAILINCARGGLVVEQDLAEWLNGGRLRAAGVDVLEQEPPLTSDPLLHARNCYITPHTGWGTPEAQHRLIDIVVANVRAFLCGQPQNVVG